MKRLGCLLLTLASITSWAETLPIAADQNSLKSYPQRFDYGYTEDTLSLGGKKILLQQFELKLVPLGANQWTVQFQWPDLFLNETQIHLKNHFGKNLLSFEAEQLPTTTHTLTTQPASLEHMTRLSKFPFIQFCLQQNQDEEYFEYCSAQYSVVKQDGSFQLVRRPSTFSQTQLQLNFETVSPLGMVILNKPSESLRIRYVAKTGETIQGSVKYKAIKILDVSRDPSGKFMLIKAEGTIPLKPTKARRIKDSVWEIRYSDDEPLFFKGFMGIPMRQDFEFIGVPLSVQNKPEIENKLQTLTYNNPYIIRGKIPNGGSVHADANLRIEGKQFEWLLPTEFDEPKKYVLNYHFQTQKYISEVSIQKIRQEYLRILTGYAINRATPVLHTEYQHWFENFFGAYHRFGFDLNYTQNLSTKANEANAKEIELRFLTKLTASMLFQSSSFDFGVIAHTHQYEGLQKTYPGLSLGIETNKFPFLSDNQRLDFKYVLGSATSEQQELASLMEFKMIHFKKITPSWFWNHQYVYSQHAYKPTAVKTPSNFTIGVGCGYLF